MHLIFYASFYVINRSPHCLHDLLCSQRLNRAKDFAGRQNEAEPKLDTIKEASGPELPCNMKAEEA